MNIKAEPSRASRKPASAFKIEFYRQCRTWHGYLSAFAFLTLIFFSATGILLNHPEWTANARPEPMIQPLQLAPEELAMALKANDRARALAVLIGKKVTLAGAYTSGDVDTDDALLRFSGVKGSSDVNIDLRRGTARIRTQAADVATILDDLHRAKNAGPVWRAMVDVAGGVLLVLSLLGYILFFSMRFKLRTSLALTGASLAILAGIFVLYVT